jgi:hypothetical protein
MRNRSIYDILNAPAVTPFLGKQCVTALGEGKSAQFTGINDQNNICQQCVSCRLLCQRFV